jgi:DeoR family fructose operon transcriptional repressor
LGLIEDGDVVAFGLGTTTRHVAEALRPADKKWLTFVTASISVALTLRENGWEEIVLPGGELRPTSGALVGPHADRTLRMLNANVLFTGAGGLQAGAGLPAPDAAAAKTSECLAEAARKVVVVADHVELSLISSAEIATLSRVDALITDHKAPEGTLREAQLAGVRPIVAPSEAHTPWRYQA